ncbi:Uncharacterised protein [Klebsiella pneumoniae]|nr:Uncharacterised protein [Klebsiella pneumoniae]SVS61157.1 Uncharacterised protein [Klebsiella pneumoniae]SWN34388.1 Uncharacterised protein [Klebsiella pneumoniae]SYD49586.1 Uncharacterised protein [Klebsiella pneumoniae]SYP06641.1 Uncharacterised protein [Klebsiella pneumoniae]
MIHVCDNNQRVLYTFFFFIYFIHIISTIHTLNHTFNETICQPFLDRFSRIGVLYYFIRLYRFGININSTYILSNNKIDSF